MKKIVISISLLVTVLSIVYICQYNTASKTAEEAMSVAGADSIEILYEKKTEDGSILLYRTIGTDSLSIAYVNRNFSGYEFMDYNIAYEISNLEAQAGLSYVSLQKTEDVPYTIYAGITTDENLHEVLITEPSFSIAHSAKIIESDIEGTYIWMAYSPDFTGENFSLIGLSETGDIIGDIEQDGTQVTIHTIDTTESH